MSTDIKNDDNTYDKSSYTVTNDNTQRSYKVDIYSNGNYNVTEVSTGNASLGILFAILWVALIFVMPIIFIKEKIYSFHGGMIPFILSYILILFPLVKIFTKKEKYANKFKALLKVLKKPLVISIHLLFVFSAIIFLLIGNENHEQDIFFSYLGPIFGYTMIVYMVKDVDAIIPIMERLKINKYSIILTEFLEILVICIIVYYILMPIFGDLLGDFMAILLCYMFIFQVDLKLLLLRKYYLI